MKSGWNRIWVGLVIGLVVPLLVLTGYWYFEFSYLRIDSFLFKQLLANVLTPLVSLCVLGNLGIFYLYINKEYYQGGKGVIMATLIYAVIVFAIKLSA